MATVNNLLAQRRQGAKEVGCPVVLHSRVVTGSGGGPDKTILNSPRYLLQHGYGCVCMYLRPPNDPGFDVLRQRAAQSNAPLAEIDDRGAWDWRIIRQVLSLCRRENVTIWHGHDYKTNLLGLYLRRRRPMHLVTTVHGWVHQTSRTRVYHALDKWALRRYERVICVSNDLEEECRRIGVPEERIIRLDNAIDAAQFRRTQSVADAKRLLGWPNGRLMIGAVGRLAQEKGFDLLVRAVAKLVAEGRDVGAAIAGDGPEQSRLESLIRDLGMVDRVRLLGFQSELLPLYEAMDVYALSSRREGLPNVLLEAMAVGVPVVATNVAGVPTLINNGVDGFLIEAGDVDQLAAAIARLTDSVELRERIGEASRHTIVNRYDFEVRMTKVVAIYDDVMRSTEGQDRDR